MSLPDARRRLEILNYFMIEKSCFSWDVNLDELVIETIGSSEPELESLFMDAQLYVLSRNDNHIVMMEDFQRAMKDTKPSHKLKSMRKFKMIDLPEQSEVNQTLKHLMEDFKHNICSCTNVLLEGSRGTGKSFLAANIGLTNKFDFVRIFSPDACITLSESEMCNEIITSWKEAQSYYLSLIIIDDIERVLDIFHPSLTISNVFKGCLKMEPRKNHKQMVVATTSDLTFLQSIKLQEHFEISLNVPKLTSEGVAKVISELFSIPVEHRIPLTTTLAPVAIKDLIHLLQLGTRKQDETNANGSGTITDVDTVYRMANLMLK